MRVGFFGVGAQEIVVLLLGSTCLLLVVVPIVVLALRLGRQSARVMSLEEENRQLREELERRGHGSA